MGIRLDTADPRFEARFVALLATKREIAEDVEASARTIVDDVRKRGDEALYQAKREGRNRVIPAAA